MVLSAAIIVSACGKSNNLLLGRVEANLGTHTIVVTDCYRTTVPSPRVAKDSVNGSTVYRWAPCEDADVIIHNDQLVVNGKAYETLTPGDSVIVDHGQVLVNTHIARRTPETQ